MVTPRDVPDSLTVKDLVDGVSSWTESRDTDEPFKVDRLFNGDELFKVDEPLNGDRLFKVDRPFNGDRLFRWTDPTEMGGKAT